MSFKYGIFVPREKEIARYLNEELSPSQIAQKTGLTKKIIEAHIKNMMLKLKAKDKEDLQKLLKKV